MQLLNEVYRRSLAPVVIVISALSAASAVFLLLGMPPRITSIDPATVTFALVAAIVVFGTVVPVLTLLVWRRRRRPSFPLAVAFLLVMFAHAVSLGEPVAVPGQSLTSVLALAIGAAMAITVLVLAIEDQRSISGTGSVRRGQRG